MTNLITPPPELVQQWVYEWNTLGVRHPDATSTTSYIAARAAQWGADQELEACCECMSQWYRAQSFLKLDGDDPVPLLRAARRPKPPSLKQQALAAQQRMWDGDSTREDWQLIRRALEQLDD